MLLDAAQGGELKGNEETIDYFRDAVESHITRNLNRKNGDTGKGIDVRNNQAGYCTKPFNFLDINERYVVILKGSKPIGSCVKSSASLNLVKCFI